MGLAPSVPRLYLVLQRISRALLFIASTNPTRGIELDVRNEISSVGGRIQYFSPVAVYHGILRPCTETDFRIGISG